MHNTGIRYVEIYAGIEQGVRTAFQQLFYLQGGIFILVMAGFLHLHTEKTLTITFQFRPVLIDTMLFGNGFPVGIKPKGKPRCIKGLHYENQE